ncbi:hypothetical protein ACFE04_014164 [Oxalis oulophora]
MSMISRLSRAGIQMLKPLSSTRGTCITVFRDIHSRPLNQYQRRPLFELHPKMELSGALFQKYHRFSTTATSDTTNEEGSEQEQTITVTFVDKDGEEQQIKVPIGMSILEAAHHNDIELEGKDFNSSIFFENSDISAFDIFPGACEGSLACSTCHVIVMDVEYYNKLDDPTDEENDMLDLAFGLTETSRLGCQVIASPELDGIRVALPPATRNFAVDGFIPKPH